MHNQSGWRNARVPRALMNHMISGGKRLFAAAPNKQLLMKSEKFEDTKGVFRRRNFKDRQCNGQIQRAKGQTKIDIILHTKLTIDKHEPH